MKGIINEVLALINDKNYEAYIVGGAVIATFKSGTTKDIDIATNCPSEILATLFPQLKVFDYGASKVKYKGYLLEFTHFRRDLLIIDGNLVKYELVNDLSSDATRRDISINAIYMDKDYQIYDFYNGVNDYDNKIIRSINDYQVLYDDPLKMLRIIRFMVTYKFMLDDSLAIYLKKHLERLYLVKPVKIYEELTKIFKSPNLTFYMPYLRDINFFHCLGIEIDQLVTSNDYLYLWSQVKNYQDYPLSKKEKREINKYLKISC